MSSAAGEHTPTARKKGKVSFAPDVAVDKGEADPEDESMATHNEAILLLWLWFAGLSDALAFTRIVRFFRRSRTVRSKSAKCFLLNGIIFLGSIVFVTWAVKPLMHWMLHLRTNQSQAARIQGLYDVYMEILYHILWLYPVYSISFILNTIWYQDIADHAYRVQFGRPPSQTINYDRWVKMIVDEIYRMLLVGSFLIQVGICCLVPYIGTFITFLSLCWLYSFYSFDYKWVLKGWHIEKRLLYVETHWAYFAGFGTPCTLATFFSTQFVSAGIWAFLFPFFIMLATPAKPIKPPNESRQTSNLPFRMPIFKWARWLNFIVLRNIQV